MIVKGSVYKGFYSEGDGFLERNNFEVRYIAIMFTFSRSRVFGTRFDRVYAEGSAHGGFIGRETPFRF